LCIKCQELNLGAIALPQRRAKLRNILAEKNLRAIALRMVNDRVVRTNDWVRHPKYLPWKSWGTSCDVQLSQAGCAKCPRRVLMVNRMITHHTRWLGTK
jgi:hypothetical protein